MKNLYRVSFYYEEKGNTDVLADTAEEAELLVREELSEEGLERLNYETNDRDYDTTGVVDITEREEGEE